MWLKNNYVRTLAGIIAAVLFLVALQSPRSAADGSPEARAADPQPNQVAPSAPTYPNLPQSGLPVPSRLLQVAANSDAPANGYWSQPYTDAVPSVPSVNSVPSPITSHGLPAGTWSNETPLGRVSMTVKGSKISIDVKGSGELAMFQPSLRGEFSIASDGTIYGLIHSVDLGVNALAAQELDEEFFFLNGLSDIPFSMRAYSEPGVLAVKEVTLGIPTKVLMATDGEFSELSIYAQAMMTGIFTQTD